MHTMRYVSKGKDDNGPAVWDVGYWNEGFWESLRDFPTQEKAAKYVNYLNGGNEKVSVDAYVMEP